jgi:uncharacterized protein YcbK (DUF882 family)
MDHDLSRRRFVGALCGFVHGDCFDPEICARRTARELHFYHTHTGERLSIAYRDSNGYIPDALAELSRFLADIRTGERMPIDPGVFDIQSSVQQAHGQHRHV